MCRHILHELLYPRCAVESPSRVADGRNEKYPPYTTYPCGWDGYYNLEAYSWDGGDCNLYNTLVNCNVYDTADIGNGNTRLPTV